MPPINSADGHGSTEPERVGLVAGWGSFPVEVAERLASEGKQVYVIALKGHADSRLEQIATKLQWMGVLRLGGHMRFFAKHDVQRCICWQAFQRPHSLPRDGLDRTLPRHHVPENSRRQLRDQIARCSR